MFRLWKCYQNCLRSHPVKTQVISSGLIWGFGDIAAQTITHSTAKKENQIQTQVKIPITGTLFILNFISSFSGISYCYSLLAKMGLFSVAFIFQPLFL